MSEMMHAPDGWEVKKVSDCILSKNDKSKQLNTTEYLDTGKYPIVDQSKNFIAGYTNEISKLINIEEPIVIFGDHTRELKYINFDFCCGADGTQLIKNKNFIDISFLFYALENIDLANYGYDRHFKHLKNSNILIPKEKKEQEKIAKILSTLDKSIEATNRLIEKEKNIKKSLMQELLTNGIDKDGHIRTRATHTYKESELGLIPDEWEIVSLKDVTQFIKDGTHGTHEDVDIGIPLLSAKDIDNGKIDLNNEPRLICEDDYKKIHKNYQIEKNDILLTIVGTIGRVAIVKIDDIFTLQRSVAILRTNKQLTPVLCYHILSSNEFLQKLLLMTNASAQGGVYLGSLGTLKIKIPKEITEQKQVTKILTTQDKKIQTEETNLAKLKELKKGLMNDLLSGKVRVKV